MTRPRVCVVGSGGREHALCLALSRSADVVTTPGNAGMAAWAGGAGTISTTTAAPEDVEADLFVIGPEAPLVAGLADRLRALGRRVVGPGADGARLEGSKAYMKGVLSAAGVPTARYGAFGTLDEARAFLHELPGPWVVKTDGLASGKGVTVASSLEEAEADVAAKLSGSFGVAGRTVVVEEGLSGPECSLLALCDGTTVVPMVPAQDFKRAEDGDRGPNTGGMGAYAPLPSLGAADVDELVDRAIAPVLGELVRRGIDYRGVLYAGLMLTEGGPRVLEFNVRLGDPEAQVVLPLVAEDLAELFGAVADGRLASAVPGGRLAAPGASAVCVVMAADGYPASPVTGAPIGGLGADGQLADPVPGVTVVHAATRRESPDGPFLVDGGRVLGVTAEAASLGEARRRAYSAVERISWPGARWRRDIAARAVPEAAEAR
ncbi:MAG: phosphoribosylamine--glycine ligase [Actinomycetota bacterium]|nr:phosphoribosylamine--glycine ligase [Actinomycetota bacterium]